MFSVLGWSARFFFSSHHIVYYIPRDIIPLDISASRVWRSRAEACEACDCEACVHEALCRRVVAAVAVGSKRTLKALYIWYNLNEPCELTCERDTCTYIYIHMRFTEVCVLWSVRRGSTPPSATTSAKTEVRAVRV